jgi:hypothetical protein
MLLQLTKFERAPWLRFLAPLLAALLVASAYHGASRAAPEAQRVYVLSDNEGYGLNDCITQKRDCGKIVADSWCEAHGHGPALAFGGAEDVTGAISTKGKASALASGAAMVTCAD